MILQRSLERGTVIGRFTVEELIGAGGMGEVYAARDTQLGRRVALKILPLSRASERDRVDRFLREARAASSLNHPSIVTIFDSGTEGEVHYLAMELIEGETLTEWARGGRNRDKLPPVLMHVAEGLARAHAGGIVHRDLKPDNVMVARGGAYAKIVDFGIAKLTEREEERGGLTAETAPSAILGTTSFMSPEQVEGRAVDHRSDVFSFGCLLYAAYQGKSPFDRGSNVSTMSAIVSDAPPPLPEAPPPIERIARRCLAKDPDERYQSMKDIALDLREQTGVAMASRQKRSSALVFIAFAAAVILAAAAWMAGHPRQQDAVAPAASEIAPQMTMVRLTNTGKVVTGSVSPDGKYIVYSLAEGDSQTIWVKQIATGTDVRIIPPTNGFYNDLKVSLDGNWVFYTYSTRENANVNDIYRIPILGGDSRKVANDVEPGIGIAPDGHRIAFRRFNAVTRVVAMTVADIDAGTERVVLTRMPPDGFGTPSWTPDGRNLTFILGGEGKRANIVNFDLETSRTTRMQMPPWPGFGGIAWIPDGSGIVLTAAAAQQPAQLWYLPVTGGAARKITNDVAFYGGLSFTADSKSFVTNRQEHSSNLWLVDFATGKARALTFGLGTFSGSNGVQWMPDATILYTAPGLTGNKMIWRLLDPQSGNSRELPLQRYGWRPALSPDRKKLLFFSSEDGHTSIWVADSYGENQHRMTTEPIAATNASWMPDSRSIVYIASGTAQAAWRVDVETGERVRLTDRPVNTPAVSPDGKAIICRYRSDEPGKPLWRTALLSMDGKLTRFFDIPRAGGPHVFEWLPNGTGFLYLDFMNGVGNIWLQPVDGSAPRQITRFDSGRIAAYDLSGDGKSIVVSHVESVNDLVLIKDFR